MRKLPLGCGLPETVSVPGAGDQIPDAAGVPEFWLAPVLGIAALLAAVLIAVSGRYGYLLPRQLALISPYLAAVWITGLVRLFRDRTLRWCRALGVACVVLAAAFVVTGASPTTWAGCSRCCSRRAAAP